MIEKETRINSNKSLEELNKKVKDLENKYSSELSYYKDAYQVKEEELIKKKEKFEKFLENVNIYIF